MRFGITALSLPNVMDMIITKGITELSRFNFAEIVRTTYEQGFSLMELTMDIAYVLPGSISDQTISELIAVKDDLDITYTVHLPLWAIEPAIPNDFIRRASINNLVDAINLVKPLNPEVYVLHMTGGLAGEFYRQPMPAKYKSVIVSTITSFAEESLKEILRETRIPPRKLALENIEFSFEATWGLAERFDTSICMDTGHLLSEQSEPITILEFINRYYDRIAEIHLHDGGKNPPKDRRVRYLDHQPLGTGELPIIETLNELHKRGYKGPIIFELVLDEAKESLALIKKLLPELPIQ